MTILTYIIIFYLLIINITGFTSMGIDKRKAIKHLWRIPEKTLFTIALLGGSIGSSIGMYTFRHKTQHKSFVIGIPSIVIVQVAIIILIMINF